MSETGVATVNARAHPALKLLGVKTSMATAWRHDLRTGVQADACTLFTAQSRGSFRKDNYMTWTRIPLRSTLGPI
jgi:hypothetical protein